MSAATITAIGAPRSMTTWIKLGLAAIVIGAICWGFFLAMPKLLMTYRTSRVARLFLGLLPALELVRKEIFLQVRCIGCGAALSTPLPD